MSEIVKICKVHGELTIEGCLGFWYKKKYFYYKCKVCAKLYGQRWRTRDETRRAKIRESNREYYHKCKETEKGRKHIAKRKEATKRFIEKDRAAYNAWQRGNYSKNKELIKKQKKVSRDTLSDSYVRRLICMRGEITPGDVSKEMIELKRSVAKIRRLVKFSYGRQI